MASRNLADLDMRAVCEVIRCANEAVRGANRAPRIDEPTLKNEIEDLLCAVGIANDGSESAVLFANPPVPDATHEDLVKQHLAIAASDDPLDRRICYGTALAELNAKARSKWTSRRHNRRFNRPHMLLGVTSDFLTQIERADIKEFAFELAAYHQAQIRRERPAKIDQDTLLDGLADIYLSHTNSAQHRYELPHSIRSHFIRFCHAVLRPFFPLTELSPKALSNRWNGLKKQHYKPRLNPRFSMPADEG
jgi:hypothetical protein